MSIAYSYLIDENIAPSNASKIGVYKDDGTRVGSIDIPNSCKISSELGNKLYTCGVLSDVHYQASTGSSDFRKALQYLNGTENAEFTCICGDLTLYGTANELSQWKKCVDDYAGDMPVYAMAGNHEGKSETIKDELSTYTGQQFNYYIEKGNDVYVFVGTCKDASEELFGAKDEISESLKWLHQVLENFRNKRVFLFQHVRADDSCGNALGIYKSDIWNGEESLTFEALVSHYTNVIWFHGHSHIKYYKQVADRNANIDKHFGCTSVHISSLAVPRDGNGPLETANSSFYADSEGYIMDVYENGIVLRARDFVTDKFISIAQYQILTPLTTIEPNSFVDPTGKATGKSIEFNLTNARCSYSKKFVKNGLFTTSITPTAGYEIKAGNVSITMGENDISNQFDTTTNTLTISNVTGDLVISIEATEKQVDTDTYEDFSDWTLMDSSLDFSVGSNGKSVIASYQSYPSGIKGFGKVFEFEPNSTVNYSIEVSSDTGVATGANLCIAQSQYLDTISTYNDSGQSGSFTVPSSGKVCLVLRVSSAYSRAGGTYPVTFTFSNLLLEQQ